MTAGASNRAGMIRALKIGLPVLALAVFASLFLFNSARYSDQISFDGVDLSALEEGLKLVNPRFTGATNRGEPFTVVAEWALPDGPRPERVELSAVTGEMNLIDGRVVTLAADTGVLEPKKNVLSLDDGVRFASSDGYQVTAGAAVLNAATETLTAQGEVTATGPIGRIRADRMRAERKTVDGSEDKSAYIWFENRVKVRIEKPNLAQE